MYIYLFVSSKMTKKKTKEKAKELKNTFSLKQLVHFI